MEPIIAAVEKSTGQAFEKLEVWHNAENAEVMKQHAEKLRAACGGMLGVPAFYNEKTKEALCGEVDEDTLRAWAVKGTP